MTRKTLNQTLAENLSREMARQKLTAKALALKAGVAPNTVGNYLRSDGTDYTASGKERSAKLAEVERIAAALGVSPLSLLTDHEEFAARVAAAAALMVEELQREPGGRSGKRPAVAA